MPLTVMSHGVKISEVSKKIFKNEMYLENQLASRLKQ